MVLDAWKSGKALKAPYELAKAVADRAIQPIKTKMTQNKMIHNYVDTKVEKDMKNWDPMDKSMNNMISKKKIMDKNIKDQLKSKGIYK